MPTTLQDLSKPFDVLKRLGDPELTRLRQDFPMPDGSLAGTREASAKDQAPPGPVGEAFAGNVWAAALSATYARAQNRAADVRLQLRNANRLQIVIDILSAAAASTLIGLIAGDTSKTSKIIVAAVTLLGVVLGALVAYLRRPLGDGSQFEQYVKLNAAVAEAKILVIQVRAWAQTEPPRVPLDSAIETRIEELLRELETLIGLL